MKIMTLEEKFEAAENMSPMWERVTLFSWGDLLGMRDRITALQSQLDALTWTEITPENLPTGRPYLLYFERDGEETYATGYFDRLTKSWFIDQGRFVRVGYTHFFPINPPPPSGAKEQK